MNKCHPLFISMDSYLTYSRNGKTFLPSGGYLYDKVTISFGDPTMLEMIVQNERMQGSPENRLFMSEKIT